MSDGWLGGQYFDGRRSAGHAARLRLEGDCLVLILADAVQRYPARQVRLGMQVGKAASYLWLDNVAIFECSDQTSLAALARDARGAPRTGLLHRLETNWRLILASAMLVAAFLVGSIIWGVPWISGLVAQAVPAHVEQWVGEQSMSTLDEYWLEPSGLDDQRQAGLKEAFAPLMASLNKAYPNRAWRIELRSSEALGANALALPGGIMVFTDDLVELAADDTELVSILAHEAGHVVHRHGLRGIVQSSLALWLMMSITGDLSAASDLTTSLPAILANLSYARSMETEADSFALEVLLERDIDPAHFASIMRRLEATHGQGETSRIGEFLSTHPPTRERIERFDEASQQLKR
ncbi:M48 family metallopeptidase [Halopseudomonas nanhaiensis]|uniref:M48 family metallopeptidase n=1 Tax=Halopseudomonas nanhaiensis TaxID=2830842 RepID=UPI001CBBAF3A|nr:M48 family metallopeptidase [Halopseudomonas nanhaiensis]UAW99072.1 M48 family metallopeptidase [Halopseudomonas nanhaiensis]